MGGNQSTIFDDYYIKDFKHIGRGGLCEVVKTKTIGSEEEYAVKIINKEKLAKAKEAWKYLRTEIDLLKTFNSKYLIYSYNVLEDIDNIYIVLELCKCDLFQEQQKKENKVFPLQEARNILKDVIKGIEYLHNKEYIHRDIKNSNILLKIDEGEKIYKLGDFGFTKHLADCTGSYLGTVQYQAPEIFEGIRYGKEVDIWAFGVTFYYMLNGEVPFQKLNHVVGDDKNKQNANYLIKETENFSYEKFVKKSQKKIMANCTDLVEDFFKKLFKADPKERITLEEIKEHELFKEYFEE